MMSNTNQNEQSLKDQKEALYYAALVNGWVNTRMEASKTKVTLSAGAIGILVSLLTTVGVNSFLSLLIFCFAILTFSLCCISELIVFQRNSDYLESVINGNNGNDQYLSFLDRLSISCFIFGIILSFIIGLNAGWTKYNESLKEELMTKENQTINIPEQVEIIEKSLNGIAALSPENNSTEIQSTLPQTDLPNPEPNVNINSEQTSTPEQE